MTSQTVAPFHHSCLANPRRQLPPRRVHWRLTMLFSVLPFLISLLFSTSHTSSVPKFTAIGESKPQYNHLRAASGTASRRKWTLESVMRYKDAEAEATIAYFIQISDSSLPLTTRLLSRLHHPDNFYALHFDKKIPAYRVVKLISQIKANPAYSNVIIMEREPVTYRGITMILNNIAAMSELVAAGHWDYFINLSGADYPLVSPTVQRKFLAMPYVTERRSNFFIVSPKEQWKDTFKYRFQKISVDTALGMSEKPKDSELIILKQESPLVSKLNYDFVKGEGWLILTREACKFMIESHYARKMLMSMAYSQDPSEHFYVSVLWNHQQFNSTLIPHSLRTVFWKLNGVESGQHPYTIDQVRDEDGAYTVWPWLRNSPHWFARKFSDPSNPVMDWIDNEMSGLGDNVNQTAIHESLVRVENHLHWLYGIEPEAKNGESVKREVDAWPDR